MLNYRQCSDEDYGNAMKMKRMVDSGKKRIVDIPTTALYIIQTKMAADAERLMQVGTPYSCDIGGKSQASADEYLAELKKRGVCGR